MRPVRGAIAGAAVLAGAAAIAAPLIATAPAGALPDRSPPPSTRTPSSTAPSTTGPAAPPAEDAQAWILVDADSGVVLDGGNLHQALPASTTAKLMTALTFLQRMPLESPDIAATLVTVTARATGTPQPRLGVGVGSRWQARPLLNAMVLASSNDAAYALAEGASGTIEAFANEMTTLGRELGLRDSTWNDPAGIDDDKAYNGGPMVSAWDLAIVGRAILHDKELAGIVRDREETVNGPGLGKKVTNTNDLLYKYPGATGMKQAQSAKAGRVIVGSATRDQRTMIVVAFGVANPVAFASEKLDAGFASQPGAKGTGNRLPDVRGSSAQGRLEALVNLPPTLGRPALLPGPAGGQAKPRAGVPTATAGATTTPRKQKQHTGGGGGVSLLQLLLIVMLLGVVAALLMSRRRTVEQQRRQRVVRQRTLAEARRRGTIDIIDPDQVAGSGHVRIVGPARPGRPGRGGR